tara:strand:- start:61 stop:282 length:222 start_codon:yes stop_codon:yes gene_type:complete
MIAKSGELDLKPGALRVLEQALEPLFNAIRLRWNIQRLNAAGWESGRYLAIRWHRDAGLSVFLTPQAHSVLFR